MTADDGHGDLPLHASRLVTRLERLRTLFVFGRVGHDQHAKFAARSALLADQLNASLLLSDQRRYAPALAVVRTGLEHHLADRLLFLATRYLQVYPVKKADLAGEEARLSGLKAGPRPDIAGWRMKDGRMNVVIRGFYPEGLVGRGRPTLSPYYFAGDHYDPFTGRPRNLPQLAGAFQPIGQRRRWAEESRSVWRSLFVYEKLRRNLLLNRLLTARQAVQLDVHYGFLSAFAHAMERAYDLVYGRNIPSSAGEHDHYASELILLYVVTLASEELMIFARAAARTPRLGLRDWSVVAAEIEAARTAASHLWFLWGEPTILDRINDVHTRLARGGRGQIQPPIDPASIPSNRVRYYTNPLARLVDLHRGSRELTTGLGFNSPFPRADAARRI